MHERIDSVLVTTLWAVLQLLSTQYGGCRGTNFGQSESVRSYTDGARTRSTKRDETIKQSHHLHCHHFSVMYTRSTGGGLYARVPPQFG